MAALAGAATMTAGCGGDSGGGFDPVAHAADVTAHQGTAQVRFTAEIASAGRTIPMTGEGIVSTKEASGDGRMTFHIDVNGKRQTIQEIFRGGAIYMGRGPLEGKIPLGKKWMKIDFRKILAKHDVDLSKYDSGGGNATQTLAFLRGSGDVKKVGTERVRGVSTTHYHAEIDFEKAVEKTGDEQYKKLMRQSLGDATSGPADVWIDPGSRVRRIRMKMPMGPASMDMTIDFLRFGVVMNLDVPSSDDVFDGTGLAEKQISQAGGG
jgi:hypothetical protein